MTDTSYAAIRSIKDFESLVEYLRYELDWPLDEDLDVEDLAFDYEPEELGLDKGYEVKVRDVKQLRPASGKMPWGIFYVDFDTKRLPVVVLRRALRALVPKKRASAASAHQATWDAEDLLFIAATGEEGNRGISFVHFEKADEGQPRLKTLAWDEWETHFFYLQQNIARLSWPRDEDDAEGWREQWASAFTTEHREVIRTAKELSAELARLARNTRDLIQRVYSYEAQDGALHKLHESFQTVLFEDLDEDGFADMVAQTISYGLFSARATGEPVLGLSHLEAMVPNTNPFLKELFAEFVSMSGSEKHQIDFDELGVSELVEMLNEVNVEAVLQDFGKQTGGGNQDPVIYFYEEFLKDYDKAQKVKRGEFYTPKPVVSYIVRSVDRVLRDELGCPDGLADTSTMQYNGETWPKVMILDPAAGTGTFLETVIEVVYETMTGKWRKEGKKPDEIHAAWNEYVPKHLLPRLHGFELMMAPYSVAHMKLGLALKETGYEFDSDERLRVYLTNTLEEPKDFSGRLYAEFLAHEAEAANRVKRDVPVTVVLGNPPYSGKSSNLTPYARKMIELYKYIDGKKVKEKGALQLEKNLNDDYVKFIRAAQLITGGRENTVIGLITNNSFLENPTLRGMRWSLLQAFDSLSFVDLHGNIARKEKAADGSRDQNVFDIGQGVSVSLLVRRGLSGTQKLITRKDIFGARSSKYSWLIENTDNSVSLSVDPQYPFFLFRNEDAALRDEYELGVSVIDLFPSNSTGIKTHRDKFCTDFDLDILESRLEEFVSLSFADNEIRAKYTLPDTHGFKLSRSRERLQADRNWSQYFNTVLYRPFDWRWIYFSNEVVELPRNEIMNHMIHKHNLGLVTTRQITNSEFQHVLCSQTPIEMKTCSHDRSTNLFPLYIYPSGNLFDADREERNPNLAPEFVAMLSKTFDLSFVSDGQGDLEEAFGPEDVFHYAYTLFHSPAYRTRYAEFLKQDFPRLPLTSSLALFSELCKLGEELVALHLMRSPLLDDPFTTFPKSGSNVMEKAKHDPEKSRVYINKEGQYFDNVPEETWNFRIGGYQVLDKWLKDRKGRNLTHEDIEHYKKVVKALHETARIMRKIDEVIEAHGGWPLAGSVKETSEEGA